MKERGDGDAEGLQGVILTGAVAGGPEEIHLLFFP